MKLDNLFVNQYIGVGFRLPWVFYSDNCCLEFFLRFWPFYPYWFLFVPWLFFGLLIEDSGHGRAHCYQNFRLCSKFNHSIPWRSFYFNTYFHLRTGSQEEKRQSGLGKMLQIGYNLLTANLPSPSFSFM